MNLLHILSPDLPPTDIIARSPDWTRADFNRAVFHVSSCLKNQHTKTVALWFDDAAMFACGILAAWLANAEAWLLPNLTDENIAWAHSADAILTDNAAYFSDSQTLFLPDLLANLPEKIASPQNWQIPENARGCLKTSGSTGEPQIIVKTAAQMATEALALAAAIPFGQDGADVLGSVSPQHMYGFTFRFALALTMSWTMARQQAVYPETLLAETTHSERTIWVASPAVLIRLVGVARQNLSNKIIGIFSAGSTLPEHTAEQLTKIAVRPFEIYGSTETGIIAHRGENPLWQPFAAVKIRPDEDGTFFTSSDWNVNEWHSADVIELDHHQQFKLIGRQDRIIKLEDKRVSLAQLEHQLLQHEWIADAHCSLHPTHQRVAAWIALNADGIAQLREHGRAHVLGQLKIYLAVSQDKISLPRYWRFATELPRNAQSKILATDVKNAFLVGQTVPIWEKISLPENTDTPIFRGKIPLDLVYFGGHFADFPLVPGAIQLQWINDLARQFDFGRQSILQIENLKYQQFIRPNDEITITLKYDSEKNKLSFTIHHHIQAACASGRIAYQ